VKPKTEPETGN